MMSHVIYYIFNGEQQGLGEKKTPKVCRYALVEMIDVDKIDSRNKEKEDEVGLTQKEIWDKKYKPKNGSTGF